jgi:signal transduction histidine kinase
MSLQVKILVIVLAVVSLYAAFDYASQQFFILPSFVAMEQGEAQNTMRRCVGALRREISEIDNFTKSWAASEQVYQFIENRKTDQSIDNPSLEFLANTNESLNLIYICDVDGKVVWGQIRDSGAKKKIQFNELSNISWFHTRFLIEYKTAQSSIAGVFMTGQGPMLISSRPIITNKNEDSICGAFIAGRYLNDKVLKTATEHVPVELKVWTIADDLVPAEEKDVLNHIAAESQFYIRKGQSDVLHVYTLFSDIHGTPALLMRADIRRDVRARGIGWLVRSNFISNFGNGLSVMLVLLLLLRRKVVAPLEKLTRHVVEIGKKKDITAKLSVERNDEIGTLAKEFNHMVEQLAEAREKLLEQSYSLGKAETATRMLDDARKRTEELEDAYRKLEDANQELRDFAHIVSHDLKAPLRGIRTVCDWILTDSADKLGKEGKEQMNLLLSRVERMHNLIGGVLQYSKVGCMEEKKELIDLNEIISEVIDMIGFPENIKLSIEEELPVIECGQIKIMQVFGNLLGNAVKHMDKPQGHVIISYVEEDGFWKFSIADNGPGIEEKHFERIFRMFQTLKPRDKFESTGIGLTVVKKIVESYGGRIWVESKLGEGSVFYFTFPKQETQVSKVKVEAGVSH